MTSICPVCNGLLTVQPVCPLCRRPAEDLGTYSDAFDPYSPYRDLESLSMTDGFIHNGYCLHLSRCGSCRRDFIVPIAEW